LQVKNKQLIQDGKTDLFLTYLRLYIDDLYPFIKQYIL